MGKRFFILSSKKWTDYYPLQVVYEWEEIISETLNIPIDATSQIIVNTKYDNNGNQWLQKIIRNTFLKKYVDSSFNYFKTKRKGEYLISFLLNPIPVSNHYIYQNNSIVILLDVFADSIDMLPQLFKNKLIFVTNIEVLNYFASQPIFQKLRYIPLSISDRYYNNDLPKKNIDVIQVGRQNIVLHDWMLRFISKNPAIEYVYSKKENGVNIYYSTTKGDLHIDTSTRQQFMDFLGSAKISLLSAPGIDGGELLRTGGFNPVTPRFYESAVNYCYMIGRYPDTADFLTNHIYSVCERPTNYEDFEKMLLQMLNTPFNKKEQYDVFINKHLTSTVARSIGAELEKLT
jgi:hypothetical protein